MVDTSVRFLLAVIFKFLHNKFQNCADHVTTIASPVRVLIAGGNNSQQPKSKPEKLRKGICV